MFDGQTKSHRGPIILNVDAEALEIEGVEEVFHDLFQMIEGISEVLDTRARAIAIPRIIRRDHMKALAENWKQGAKHMGRGRKPVQQDKSLYMLFSRLAIKHLNVVDYGLSVRNGCHGSTPFDGNAFILGALMVHTFSIGFLTPNFHSRERALHEHKYCVLRN